jgi:hypothetical protein
MADEQNFPTAIVPTRPGGVEKRWDDMARRFGDPMARLFFLANNSLNEDTQARCASELMPYRYPKLRVQELRAGEGGAGAVSVTINFGARPDPVARALDVTPVPAALPPAPDPLD